MSHDDATDPVAIELYQKILGILNEAGIKYMVGGGISLVRHANIERVNDLDIFCKAGDYPYILNLLQERGIGGTVRDEKWLAQVTQGEGEREVKVDFIFSSPNSLASVDDEWFSHAKPIKLFDMPILLVPPEEVIWCKLYVQRRDHYDGADINHIILTVGAELNWHRLLARLEPHWELLLAALINYRFVFPSERDKVPRWLMEELLQDLPRRHVIVAGL
jgi:hypothetical protein